MGTNRPWPERAEQILRQCWPEGLSAERIAHRIRLETLFRVTRNAVLGKVWRLGLCDHGPGRQTLHPEEKRARNRERSRQWAARRREALAKLGFRSARPPSRALTAAELSSALRDAPPLPFDPHAVRELQLLDCEPKEHERVSLIEAKRHQCRWPFPNGMVCGRKTVSVGGGSYCSHHASRAYYPKSRRVMAVPSKPTPSLEGADSLAASAEGTAANLPKVRNGMHAN